MMVSYKERLEGEAEEEEEEVSEEDEVFGPHNNNSVNKPLMAPRRRSDILHTRVRRAPPPLRLLWGPLCYGLVAISTLVGLIFLVIFLARMLMWSEGPGLTLQPLPTELPPTHPPCAQLSVSDVWARTFPMLTTETAIRLADLNKDGTEDIVMGFGTGAESASRAPGIYHLRSW
ncbi:hypothetical protein LAZ67_8001582 [Cordylochernes scorpioides]|uniref:Uncharacterized protein n=1 Tax=Cordylochernes scorpioides TaxID=51811 RepID=A0ABY6KQB6_9ARAC|nr:hypothetical protein LAZ67_8001582 [Cordylochernes scorpioides]